MSDVPPSPESLEAALKLCSEAERLCITLKICENSSSDFQGLMRTFGQCKCKSPSNLPPPAHQTVKPVNESPEGVLDLSVGGNSESVPSSSTVQQHSRECQTKIRARPRKRGTIHGEAQTDLSFQPSHSLTLPTVQDQGSNVQGSSHLSETEPIIVRGIKRVAQDGSMHEVNKVRIEGTVGKKLTIRPIKRVSKSQSQPINPLTIVARTQINSNLVQASPAFVSDLAQSSPGPSSTQLVQSSPSPRPTESAQPSPSPYTAQVQTSSKLTPTLSFCTKTLMSSKPVESTPSNCVYASMGLVARELLKPPQSFQTVDVATEVDRSSNIQMNQPCTSKDALRGNEQGKKSKGKSKGTNRPTEVQTESGPGETSEDPPQLQGGKGKSSQPGKGKSSQPGKGKSSQSGKGETSQRGKDETSQLEGDTASEVNQSVPSASVSNPDEQKGKKKRAKARIAMPRKKNSSRGKEFKHGTRTKEYQLEKIMDKLKRSNAMSISPVREEEEDEDFSILWCNVRKVIMVPDESASLKSTGDAGENHISGLKVEVKREEEQEEEEPKSLDAPSLNVFELHYQDSDKKFSITDVRRKRQKPKVRKCRIMLERICSTRSQTRKLRQQPLKKKKVFTM